MATYKKGILGVFSGKVGTVIGSTWKGVDYMRSLPKSSTKTPTQAQLDQRIRFALVNAFIKPIAPLIRLGYQSTSGNVTPLNAAIAYHLKESVTGISPDFAIDYSKVLFSRGELLGPWLPVATPDARQQLTINWEDNSTSSFANATDMATILIYNPVTKEYMYADQVAARSSLMASMRVPANFVGTAVHAWMAFFAANGSIVSTSIYLGEITIL
ncbi:DUF6266 family protein [Pedobacter aquatilis]|uniref:DUF6266 family protein n=1 Tax=Pedobacter aquatilis TaxID=351343 RepID=UPI002930D906|nr:DUF6266 family protein [Pedobacter aquatilis]